MSKQTNMRMTGLAIAGVVLASVLGAAGPSLAQNDDPSAGITVKVHYADLDLRGQAGSQDHVPAHRERGGGSLRWPARRARSGPAGWPSITAAGKPSAAPLMR